MRYYNSRSQDGLLLTLPPHAPFSFYFFLDFRAAGIRQEEFSIVSPESLLQTGMAGEASPVPYWHELLGYLLAIPAGALGGSLARGRARPSIPRSTQGRRL